MNRAVDVFADWMGLGGPVLIDIRDVVSRWQSHARRFTCPSADIDRMRSAFQFG